MLSRKTFIQAIVFLLVFTSNIYPCAANSSSTDSYWHLIHAIDANDIPAIQAYKGDVNTRYSTHNGGSYTALHHAILKKRRHAVKELLSKGANPDSYYHWIPNWVDPRLDLDHFEYPLGMAVKAGSFTMVKALLKAHAAVDKYSHEWCDDHYTPLMIAAEKGLTAIACALIYARANPNRVTDRQTHNAYQLAPDETRQAMEQAVSAVSVAKTFAAINHPRLGAGSPFRGLPVRDLTQIYSYLKPVV